MHTEIKSLGNGMVGWVVTREEVVECYQAREPEQLLEERARIEAGIANIGDFIDAHLNSLNSRLEEINQCLALMAEIRKP